MRPQTWIVNVRRHPAQRGFDLGPQFRLLLDRVSKRPFEPRRENQLTHGSLHVAQLTDDRFDGLAFELSGSKVFGRLAASRGGFRPPALDTPFVEQLLKHGLLLRRQGFRIAQYSFQRDWSRFHVLFSGY